MKAEGLQELESAFAAARRERAGGLLVLGDTAFDSYRAQVIEMAHGSRLPVISLIPRFAPAGALMTYGPSPSEMFRRAAFYVDRILKGTKPGDIPVEQPTRFELVINLRTAKTFGLNIRRELLRAADHVIQ
ncbi:MAG: hypothetical protein HY727_03095 [Candidatus Rokubacteria bacterium]|nr:hypothetical protein [Candidatus Rokubacteria bacterium]